MTQRSKYKNKQAMRYLDYKERVGWCAKAAGARKPLEGDLHVHAIAYLLAKGPEPDVDNLGKAFLDGLNTIAFIDDRQVVKLTTEKRFVFQEDQQQSVVYITPASAAACMD